MNKLKFMDALRGYAIIGVLITHCTQGLEGLPVYLENFGRQGSRGVQLFFMVSAFTLFLSMYRKSKSSSLNFRDFYIYRFFRIAPMFYLAMVFYPSFDFITYKLGLASNYTTNMDLLFSTITFISVLKPEWLSSLVPGGWSISVEMIFYLLIPFLFTKVKNLKSAIWTTLVLLIVSQISNFLMIHYTSYSDEELKRYLFYWFPNQLPIFTLGIVLFYLLKDNIINSSFINSNRQLNLSINFGILIFFVLSFTTGFRLDYFPNHFLFGLSFLLISYGIGKVKSHFLVNRFIVFIGEISYSMYLVHFFIINLLQKFLIGKLIEVLPSSLILIVFFILTFVFTVISSLFTFKFIEKPGILLGRKIAMYFSNKNIKQTISS